MSLVDPEKQHIPVGLLLGHVYVSTRPTACDQLSQTMCSSKPAWHTDPIQPSPETSHSLTGLGICHLYAGQPPSHGHTKPEMIKYVQLKDLTRQVTID